MYDMNKTAERIEKAAAERGISIYKLTKMVNCTKNIILHLKDGHAIACDTLARIADVLGVSIDYLMMRTDTPEVNNTKVE